MGESDGEGAGRRVTPMTSPRPSTEPSEPGFRVIASDGEARPIVAHIPHGSTHIPADVRTDILLDDTHLAAELVRMTDWHTQELFAWTGALGATRFVNDLSRLVVDPERFPDDADEPMARVGQGVVYTRTSGGRPLRADDPAARAALIDRHFVPYHTALETLVGAHLERFGQCLVIDCHSFGTAPLPSEPDQAPSRPDICIGTDAFHTPAALAQALVDCFASEGFAVDVNRPFAGALVPLRWYGTDTRVSAVMIEVRRGLYCDEATGVKLPGFEAVADRIRRAVTGATALR